MYLFTTIVGCHFLLQGIFPTWGLKLHLLCLLHSQVGSLSLIHLGTVFTMSTLFLQGLRHGESKRYSLIRMTQTACSRSIGRNSMYTQGVWGTSSCQKLGWKGEGHEWGHQQPLPYMQESRNDLAINTTAFLLTQEFYFLKLSQRNTWHCMLEDFIYSVLYITENFKLDYYF